MTVLRNPSETCRIIAEIYYCPVHYPKFCRIVYPQYRYQYLCTASLNSPTNLLSNGELLKPNYRVSINHVTCGSVLTVSNVTDAFSVWLNFNFCTSLNLFYLSFNYLILETTTLQHFLHAEIHLHIINKVGIVGNAYIDLTKEEREYKCSSEITDNLSFTIIFTVEVDDSTRYRYLLNKPVVFTNSFSQKNALINHYGQIGTLQRMRS
ncbi:glyco protein hormone beta-5 [Trichinella spiralis]|uniref:glyco protein hormone beta-5 n=1 Tax=Trichinella spiralis TaxID=6334 RepID=UPI0001EFCF08|nr:glyco protein hormone beta-5 [Trichinella spiralis]